MKKQTTKENPVEIAFYSDPEGTQRIEVFYEDESLWLSQKKMAELYGVEVNTINYHLKEIFLSGELDETSVIRKIRITADDGKKWRNHLPPQSKISGFILKNIFMEGELDQASVVKESFTTAADGKQYE